MKVTIRSMSRISVTSSVVSRSRTTTRERVSVKTDVKMLSDKALGGLIALITADVTKGKFHVANAKVIATVTRPNQPPAVVELYDDGTSNKTTFCVDKCLLVQSLVLRAGLSQEQRPLRVRLRQLFRQRLVQRSSDSYNKRRRQHAAHRLRTNALRGNAHQGEYDNAIQTNANGRYVQRIEWPHVASKPSD